MTWHIPTTNDLVPEPPAPLGPKLADPKHYIASEQLLRAASVAIRLGVPLLLTGDPGTGKSAFADYLFDRLSEYSSRKDSDRALRVHARSSMEYRDLFYSYDNVGRFRDQAEVVDQAAYLKLNGLGEAILRGSDARQFADLRERLLGNDQLHQGPSREVVLIDEIDKAPRDVPNDILSLISGSRVGFEIPEIALQYKHANDIAASEKCPPIIVCTSNSERSLPHAFLRRCVYYHIEMPTGEDLARIVDARIYGKSGQNKDRIKWAEEVLFAIRESEPEKKPGLAEFLDFLLLLNEQESGLEGRMDWKEIATLTLLKTERDRARADLFFDKVQ